MPDRLTPLDATFLELEQADSAATMHIGAAMIFDAVPAYGGAPSIEEVRELVDARLGALPHFRTKLSSPLTRGLRRPSYVEDEQFDIAHHVRHASLPSPGREPEIDDWLGDFWTHPLDRARPLWEMVLVDGLANGQWMLATKTHHAMVDGVGSVDIGHALLDLSPDAPVEREGGLDAPQDDGGGWSLPGWLPPVLAYRAMKAGAHILRHPRTVAAETTAAVQVLWKDEVNAAPASSINVPIGQTRRFAAVTFDLDEVKAVKRRLGGTVNDVVLAVAAGGLRKLLTSRGEHPTEPLRAMMPVNLRGDDEHDGHGNHVTSLFVDLPVEIADAAHRFAFVHDAAAELKAGNAARGGETIVFVAGFIPPVLHQEVARTLFAPRLFNLTITNVPGPQVPLYALGARLREALPLVPLFSGHALGIAICSVDGKLTFGLNADRASVPDLALLSDGIRAAFDELRELAGQPSTSDLSLSGIDSTS